jgi:hypothetical protein
LQHNNFRPRAGRGCAKSPSPRFGSTRALLTFVQRNCPQCRRLWEAYYAAALDEFAWQERQSAASHLNDSARVAELRPGVESTAARAAALRQEIAAHDQRHALRNQPAELAQVCSD